MGLRVCRSSRKKMSGVASRCDFLHFQSSRVTSFPPPPAPHSSISSDRGSIVPLPDTSARLWAGQRCSSIADVAWREQCHRFTPDREAHRRTREPCASGRLHRRGSAPFLESISSSLLIPSIDSVVIPTL